MIVFEIFIYLLIEIAIAIAGEISVLASIAIRDRISRPVIIHPVIAILSYLVVGSILGFFSLLFFSEPYIIDKLPQVLNLIFTPIVVGLILMVRGEDFASRSRKRLSKLMNFTFGYTIALAIALTRIIYFIYG